MGCSGARRRWGVSFVWYVLGLITVPVLGSAAYFLHWSFQKTSGTGGCIVPWCHRRSYELGEHYNIVVKLAGLRHEYLTSPRHRRYVLAYWQDRKDRGMPVHPRALRKLR